MTTGIGIALVIMLTSSCAARPDPPVARVAIAVQVVDRELRDLAVTVTNAGRTDLHATLAIEVPAPLRIIGESHGAELALHDVALAHDTRSYIYEVHALARDAHVVAHLPFRREAFRDLIGRDVRAIVRVPGRAEVTARRRFGPE